MGKARSLSSYIENTPIINSTTSIVRTTSNTIMPSIEHDTSSSSDSDVEREVYPLIDLKNATTYKKLSAEYTVTMTSRYFINDLTKNKQKVHIALKDLREGQKKNNQLKHDKKNSVQFKKKKILQKKKS